MKTLLRLFVLAAALHMGHSNALEVEALYEKLSPSVWVVVTGTAKGALLSSGSAVVVEKEKLVTNCHVLRGAEWINVKRQNTMHRARLLHTDVERDLCILQAAELNAPAVTIGSLKSAKVGQRVFAIGAPQGLELTLSDGLISSLRRDAEGNIAAIQISVPVSHGSSGGGLFDKDGKLLGITTAMFADSQNLNLAVPAEWLAHVWGKPGTPLPAAQQTAGRTGSKADNPTEVAQPGPGRAFNNKEIRTHLAGIDKVKAVDQDNNKLFFRIDSERTFTLIARDRSGTTSGQYRIERNRVCLTPKSIAWARWHGCFQLFVLEDGQYQLRADNDGPALTYSRQ